MSMHAMFVKNHWSRGASRTLPARIGQIFTVLIFVVSLLGGNTMNVMAAAPAQVVLIGPEGNIGNVSDFTYEWNPVADAAYYKIGITDPTSTDAFSIWIPAADVCDATLCSALHSVYLSAVAVGDGDYTWYAQGRDASGASGPWSAPMVFTIEAAAGTLNTTITTKPLNPSTSPNATFEFTSSEAGSSFECKLDSESFAACNTPKTYNGLSDGSHTFLVRAVNGGETDPTPAGHTWVISTVGLPAKVTLIEPVGNIGNVSNPLYKWNPAAGATYYKIGITDPTPTDAFSIWIPAADVCNATVCSALHSVYLSAVAVGDGDYTWFVQGRNTTGSGPWSDPMVFTIDVTVPPDTTITSHPANPSYSATASFQFTSAPAGATFECKLDGGAFAACTTGKTYNSLSDGSHTFQVRAVNSAGADQSPALFTWTVDATPPDTAITSASQPANPSNSANASFQFTSTPAGATFECKLDSATFAACTTPKTYNGLSEGFHTFQVRAVRNGLTDQSPASYTWAIETTAPGIATLRTPSGDIGANYNPAYTWDEVPGAASYYLWVDAPSKNGLIKQWFTRTEANCNGTTCSVTPATILGGGNHAWAIQTKNSIGLGPWSAAKFFSTTMPSLPVAPTLRTPSGAIGTLYNPTYTWDEVPGATAYYLWVDEASAKGYIKQWYTRAEAGCNGTICSVTPMATLGGGNHAWAIQARNNAGDGPWSAAKTFSTTPPTIPVATVLGTPSGAITDTTPTYTWNEVPGTAAYYLWVDGPSAHGLIKQWYTPAQANCNGTTCSVTLTTTLSAGDHAWAVQTWNRAGYGPWSAPKNFTVTP